MPVVPLDDYEQPRGPSPKLLKMLLAALVVAGFTQLIAVWAGEQAAWALALIIVLGALIAYPEVIDIVTGLLGGAGRALR